MKLEQKPCDPNDMRRAETAMAALNYCLGYLPPASLVALAPHIRRVSYRVGEAMSEGGEGADILFPLSGILVVVFGAGEERPATVAMVGREGIANYHLMFPGPVQPYAAIGHVEGDALAVPAHRLRELVLLHPALRAMFYEFGARLHLQIAATLRASLMDPIEKRLARFLLMHHDRSPDDDVRVYHSAIADMLAVRRASVTDAIHRLEGLLAIRDTRGCTHIRDRSVLMGIADRSYGAAERIPEWAAG